MKTRSIRPIVGILIGLLSLLALPTYGGGGHGGSGGGGGYAGFSGGGHFSGGVRGYSRGGRSPPAGMYAPRSYSSGMLAGRFGSYYGRRSYAPQIALGRQASSSTARRQSYSGNDYVMRHPSQVASARKSDIAYRHYSGANRDIRRHPGVTTGKGETPHRATWSQVNRANKQKFERQTTERFRNWKGKASEWNEAKRNHNDHWRDRHHHGHDWWHHHSDVIVLVGWGFWGWNDGWWYPAWGYDPYYSYYEYNGPIYGYDGLQPDEVIANVQAALQQLGYHPYVVDGVLGPLTQAAIANYQCDYGLSVTGAIDPPTVRSLGLDS